MKSTAVNILVVDDDQIDVKAIKRSFRRSKLDNPIYSAKDGVEALEMLKETVPRPRFILLDINMPRMNGLELLKKLRASPEPELVFMLTTSSSPSDIAEAYSLYVAGYIVKQDLGNDYSALVDLFSPYLERVTIQYDALAIRSASK